MIWRSASIILLDSALWTLLVWLGYFTFTAYNPPVWTISLFLLPATTFLWMRVGHHFFELLGAVTFLGCAAVFFVVTGKVLGPSALAAPLISYALCAGLTLTAFQPWHNRPTSE